MDIGQRKDVVTLRKLVNMAILLRDGFTTAAASVSVGARLKTA